MTTVIHELGHWLEHADPRVMRAARELLERRTKGERALPLRALLGRRYRRDEVAKIDKIDKFLDVYMGKVYPEGYGTEVVSMGLEWLYDDPYSLLGDPDYFEFLIGLLAGEGF